MGPNVRKLIRSRAAVRVPQPSRATLEATEVEAEQWTMEAIAKVEALPEKPLGQNEEQIARALWERLFRKGTEEE